MTNYVKDNKRENYLTEEKYQKNRRKVVLGSIMVLIIGIVLGGGLLAIGISKQIKVNSKYSETNKELVSKKLDVEKQNLISSKEKLEEKINPVKDEIKSLEREKFTGFDTNYYARQDKIEELEKSISLDESSLTAIEEVLSDNRSSCEINSNSYTEKYCSLKKQLDNLNNEFDRKSDSYSTIPFYMFGGFIIIASCMIAGSIYAFAKRREILAFSAQQVMPVAKEGIEKMTPTVSKSVEEITKSVKKGLKDDK